MNDPRLAVWHSKHQPVCPSCRSRSEPLEGCARVWAPEWAHERFPVLAPEPIERELEALRLANRELLTLVDSQRSNMAALEYEVETLRREAAALRGRLAELESVDRRGVFYIAPPVKPREEE